MSRHFHVTPGGHCSGELIVPGDKSISHRVLMLGGLANGRTQVSGLLESGDCLATRDAMSAMGAAITRTGDGSYTIDGVGSGGLSAPESALDLGNSGTGMRLLCGLLAGQGVRASLVGDASLMSRPMARIAGPLGDLGASISTAKAGRPPISIESCEQLRPLTHRPKIASAQVKSAILLAGLGIEGTTCVVEKSPTRDHTERLLPAFGCPVEVDGLASSVTGPINLTATTISVPADPSSAAFFVVAACLIPGSELIVRNVGVNSRRTGFLDVLTKMGADITRTRQRKVGSEPVADLVVRHAPLTGIDVPPEWVAATIDEFPILFIAAACASGRTTVSGAAELRVKESDRIAAMATGLLKLGIHCEPREDGIVIEGGQLTGGEVDSFDDHRIAMSFAVAGALASAPVTIRRVGNVATSFPNFAALARSVGLQVEET